MAKTKKSNTKVFVSGKKNSVWGKLKSLSTPVKFISFLVVALLLAGAGTFGYYQYQMYQDKELASKAQAVTDADFTPIFNLGYKAVGCRVPLGGSTNGVIIVYGKRDDLKTVLTDTTLVNNNQALGSSWTVHWWGNASAVKLISNSTTDRVKASAGGVQNTVSVTSLKECYWELRTYFR